MDGNFSLYQTFMIVYECKGYLEAAKKHYNDEDRRGALKKSVNTLEDILGVALFEKTDNNRIVPTSDGDILYRRIEGLMKQFEAEEKEAKAFNKESSFIVRVVIPPIFSTMQFATLISDFCKEYVNAEIELITGDCATALENRQADIAISLRNDLVNKKFNVEDLYQDELIVLHKEEFEMMLPIDFDKLFIVVSEGMSDLFYKVTGIALKPKVKVDTTEQIYSFVRLGIADCGLYWKTARSKNQLDCDGLCAGDIGEFENIAPTEVISCAFIESRLGKGQKQFLKALRWFCKELKQPFMQSDWF